MGAPSPILLCVATYKGSRSYSTVAVASKTYMGNENMEMVRIEELISSRNQQKGIKFIF